MKIKLCKFFIHKWEYTEGSTVRKCKKCPKKQKRTSSLENQAFYLGEEWVNI